MFEFSTVPVSYLEQPDIEKRNKENHYALGNILFLGELFNRNLVPSHITESILNLLLQKIIEGLNIEPEKGTLSFSVFIFLSSSVFISLSTSSPLFHCFFLCSFFSLFLFIDYV